MSTQLLALINIINDSLFSIEHGDTLTGAEILEQNEDKLVTLVRRVTFYTEEARREALAARDALATLETEHPAVYALINQSMSEAHGYLWSRRLDLARESLWLHVLESQRYAPPTGYTWEETNQVIEDALMR